jgi:hypothetical protein
MDEDARQQILDEDNLRLLRIGYYISAGVTLFGSMIVLMYSFLFFFVFTQIAKTPGTADFPTSIGRLFGVFGIVITLVLVGIAVLKFVTGQQLKNAGPESSAWLLPESVLSIPLERFWGLHIHRASSSNRCAIL